MPEEDLSTQVTAKDSKKALLKEALSKGCTLRELEREYVMKVLDRTGGNKTEAATILGVNRTTLYRKLEEAKRKEELRRRVDLRALNNKGSPFLLPFQRQTIDFSLGVGEPFPQELRNLFDPETSTPQLSDLCH